jgi:hypothetical protein
MQKVRAGNVRWVYTEVILGLPDGVSSPHNASCRKQKIPCPVAESHDPNRTCIPNAVGVDQSRTFCDDGSLEFFEQLSSSDNPEVALCDRFGSRVKRCNRSRVVAHDQKMLAFTEIAPGKHVNARSSSFQSISLAFLRHSRDSLRSILLRTILYLMRLPC